MSFDTTLYAKIAKCAEKAARAGGKVISSYYRKPLMQHDKEDETPVTIADQKAEQRIRQIIIDTFPTHGIIGEEYGNENTEAEFVWVIDPIDGTKAFISGKPSFGTLIGVLHKGIPVVGVLYQPILDELWIGMKDNITLLNKKSVRTSACLELSQAILASTGPHNFNADQNNIFTFIANRVRFPVYGGDCYNYGLLAMGTIDLVIEANLKLHDVVALIPIIEGAGGVVSDWMGNSLTQEWDGSLVAASSGTLHQKALRLLQAM